MTDESSLIALMKNCIASSLTPGGLQKVMALLLASMAFGCSAPEPPPVAEPASYSPPPPKYDPASDPQPHYSILVESSPPGARIEFNDAFVGTAPCRIRIPGETGRKFGYGQMLEHVFRAIPSNPGCYSQNKTFPKGGDIPERLFFDMRLVYR